MRTVRTPVVLLGIWFISAGILLAEYGRDQAAGALIGFGLVYAAAGAVLIAWSFKPRRGP